MLGISTINIELTERCNKSCPMCGRRKWEKEHPGEETIFNRDMDWRVFAEILRNLEPGITVQLHWNGEPTLYPLLKEAAHAVRKAGCYACMNTNGLFLGDLAGDLIDFHSIAVSIIQGDTVDNYDRQQYQLVDFFLKTKTFERRPLIVIRQLGKVPPTFFGISKMFPDQCLLATRVLHAPEMSRDYRRRPTMPETGVCLDLLHHPAIDVEGNVFPCPRFNPDKLSCFGNVMDMPLKNILSGENRKRMIDLHWQGKRDQIEL